MVEALNPNNELELALESAQKKEASFDSFLFLFMNSDLFIASCSDLSVRGTNLIPLLFDKEGTPMAAVFTEKSRASFFKGQVKGLAKKTGESLLKGIPKGYGLVINPGFDVGLEILPEGIENLLEGLHKKGVGEKPD